MTEAYLIDCMEYMATLPDKAFELAICDPPYGISYARGKNGWGVCENRPTLENVKWDKSVPSKDYFDELFRVSKNQIIWGGNYFTDKVDVSKCWIVWDKCNGTENKSVFADCELAWTSFKKVCRMFRLRQMGFISDTNDDARIHPTQKPTELYAYLMKNYAKEGDRILDTHLGSGSSRIAAYDLGFDFVGCEIDKDYFDAQEERFAAHIAQQSLFVT